MAKQQTSINDIVDHQQVEQFHQQQPQLQQQTYHPQQLPSTSMTQFPINPYNGYYEYSRQPVDPMIMLWREMYRNTNTRKPRRIRTTFTPLQLIKLEETFEENPYIVGEERKQLARELNLTEMQIKVWFQNRRTKRRNEKQVLHDERNNDPTKPETTNLMTHQQQMQ